MLPLPKISGSSMVLAHEEPERHVLCLAGRYFTSVHKITWSNKG